mmetsp:Transcript_8334/g.18682  ORF Transcript_8334/g.18682 Transcript_8334/m.18682 type:complete len:247 (+) Transcript_8334:153-893(+)
MTFLTCNFKNPVLGKDYEARACCKKGGNTPSDVCPLGEDDFENGNNVLIVQLVITIVAVICFIFCIAKRESIMEKLHRSQPARVNEDAETGTSSTVYQDVTPVSESAFSFHEGNQATLQIETATQWSSKTEPGIEMPHASFPQNRNPESEIVMLRRDSIDPPAVQLDQAQGDIMIRPKPPKRQISIDPPEDEPIIDRAEMLRRSLSSTISQDVAPVVASASSINPDYNQGDATLADLEARLNNLSR